MPEDDATHKTLADAFAEFECRCETGSIRELSDIRGYVAEFPESLHDSLLYDCVAAHLDSSWRAGRRILLDDYAREFSSCSSGFSDGALHDPDLIDAEFRARHRSPFGDHPTLSDYEHRFADHDDLPCVMEILARRVDQNDRFVRLDIWGESPNGLIWAAYDLHCDTEVLVGPDDKLVHSARYPFLIPSSAEGVIGTVGEFEVLAEIGRGGMGIVFEATNGGEPVALKFLSPEMHKFESVRASFLNEARRLQRLRRKKCQHVVEIFHVSSNTYPYYSMELYERTLRDYLKSKHTLPAAEIRRFALGIARGLETLHVDGLVHCDLKPSNVFVDDQDTRIGDLGLSRHSDNIAASLDQPIGTPAYMSPEQKENSAEVDHRSDLFALGCIMHEMAFGEPPTGHASGSSETATARATTPRETLPHKLQGLIDQLLKEDPGFRPQSVLEVIDTLRGIQVEGTSPAGKSSRLSPPAAVMTVSVALMLTAGLIFTFWPEGATGTAIQEEHHRPPVRSLAGSEGRVDTSRGQQPDFSIRREADLISPNEPIAQDSLHEHAVAKPVVNAPDPSDLPDAGTNPAGDAEGASKPNRQTRPKSADTASTSPPDRDVPAPVSFDLNLKAFVVLADNERFEFPLTNRHVRSGGLKAQDRLRFQVSVARHHQRDALPLSQSEESPGIPAGEAADSFVYLYWYNSDQTIQLMWSTELGDDSNPANLYHPPLAQDRSEQFYRAVGSGDGLEAAIVGIAMQRVEQSTLEGFENGTWSLPPCPDNRLTTIVYPARGADSSQRIDEPAKGPLDGNLEKELKNLFKAYYCIVIPVQR